MTHFQQPIRVLVVDDSAFMRKAITTILQSDPALEVVGAAQNGREGITKTLHLKPDIITMDIEMPVMNGLDALREIMDLAPTPVIMMSTLTTEGAQATIEALSLGAVDFIPKGSNLPGQQSAGMKEELLSKIKSIAESRLYRSRSLPVMPPPTDISNKIVSPGVAPSQEITKVPFARKPLSRTDSKLQTSPDVTGKTLISKPLTKITGRKRLLPAFFKIVIIGVSTGGPLALQQIIPRLPADFPVGILIVQHMPVHFTKSLADRLDALSHIKVKEAQDGDTITPGTALIAPGGLQMTIGRDKRTVRIQDDPSNTLYRPCVDRTVDSVVEHFGGQALGVIMTGMGRDGCSGLKHLHEHGGFVLSQDAETCVVYGMPRAVVEEGIADEIHPLGELAEAIASCLGKHALRS